MTKRQLIENIQKCGLKEDEEFGCITLITKEEDNKLIYHGNAIRLVQGLEEAMEDQESLSNIVEIANAIYVLRKHGITFNK